MIGTDLALALDPARVMDRLGTPPDAWQRAVMRSTARQVLLNITRQGGKSTTVGALAAWTARYQAGSLTLCLSPSQRQSGELFRKVRDGLQALGVTDAALVEDNALSVRLANGSRVVSLPGREQTVRGYSGATLLLVDEASRVDDQLYFGIRPMLAVSGGRVVLLSTPFGKRGVFFHEWTEGGPAWERFEVTADQCPRIGAAFLAEERRALPRWVFEQEYYCRFAETEDQVFRYEDVLGALSADVAPLFPTQEA